MLRERTQRLNVRILPAHKAALEELAKREGEAVAVVVRNLIKDAARERGLWPPVGANGHSANDRPTGG